MAHNIKIDKKITKYRCRKPESKDVPAHLEPPKSAGQCDMDHESSSGPKC